MLLGFYVSTMMNRWWSQLAKLPHLADVALSLNGITTPGKLASYLIFQNECSHIGAILAIFSLGISNCFVYAHLHIFLQRF